MIGTNFKRRIKALFIDYLCIVLYLLIIFALILVIYNIFLDSIPEFTEETGQWVAFLTTVLPITIYYSFKESGKSFASFGKRKAGLMVKYKRDPIIGSIIRNVLKFLPWQFGHMAVIRGIYNGFDSYHVKIFYGLAILLPVIYTGMVLLRKDHRHIPDILAKSNVEVRQSKNKVN